jgi:hypothetical protein
MPSDPLQPRGRSRFAVLKKPVVLLGLLCLATAATTATAAVETHFDADLEGWRITGDNAAAWNATGGNPGGCLSVNDLAIGDDNRAVAPPSYLGDWSGMTSADSVGLDYYFQNTSGGAVVPPAYVFRIAGLGGAAHALLGYVPPQLAWTSVRVSLSPADWIMESGSWSALLAHVNSLTIAGEFVSGEEVVRLDNIRLTADVVQMFETCVTETFTAAGLADWSFGNTGGATNPGSGGNSGGFCQIADGTGASYAYAPSRYLGDWSPLNGSGRLTIDVRILSHGGTPVDVAEFIRLSGPGGTAVVPMPAADLPPVGRIWKTYGFPLQAASWTVTTGTWAGLLANVTECRIQMEFINGTEVVGFDNFGRLTPSCPPLDIPVVVSMPGVALCGYSAFVGISTVARNPADGRLYGTVDAATGSGGGLWALAGPSAGTRLQAYDLPAHLIYDAAGNAFITEDNSGNIYRYAAGGGSSLWVSGFHTGDDDPSGLCIAPVSFDGPNVDPGDFLVTDCGYSGPDEVWAFTALAPENERLVMPDPGDRDFRDIAGGRPGIVYLAGTIDPNTVTLLSADGSTTTLPLDTPLAGMVGIVYDNLADRIYVLAQTDRTLRRIHPGTGHVDLVASGFVGIPYCGIEIDTVGRKLWVVDAGANRVYEFCLDAQAAVDGESIAIPQGSGPATLQVQPNPTQSITGIRFTLACEADARLEIHDPAGRLVRRLSAGRLPAGEHELQWDGRDENGRRVASGLYLMRLTAGSGSRSSRLTVLR